MPTRYVDPAPAAYVGAVLEAVHAFDQPGVRSVLDDADALHGVDTTVDEVVFPALRLVGMFWASGTMDIAHEHLLSAAVTHWVAARSAFAPALARAGTILLATGAEDRHTLALDCLDLLLASRGVQVCNLGAQTPAASLLVAVRALRPAAVLLVSQTPTVASEAVDSVRLVAEAGIPVYVAGSSFVREHFREQAPGIALDATLREAAEMLTAHHTTPLPVPEIRTGRHAAAVRVDRAVEVAREVRSVEAAEFVVSTRDAVQAAAVAVALAARSARAGRAEAARSAAEAVASSADRAAAAVRTEAPPSSPVGHDAAAWAATASAAARVAAAVADAAAQVARAVEELDVAIEREVTATAARVEATAAAAARRAADETLAHAVVVATAARGARAAAGVLDDDPVPTSNRARCGGQTPSRSSSRRWLPTSRRGRQHP